MTEENQTESAEKPLNAYDVLKKFCNECGNPLVTDEQKSTLTCANCKLNVIAKHVTDRSLRKLDHDGKTGKQFEFKLVNTAKVHSSDVHHSETFSGAFNSDLHAWCQTGSVWQASPYNVGNTYFLLKMIQDEVLKKSHDFSGFAP